MPVRIRIQTDTDDPLMNYVKFASWPDGEEFELPVTRLTLNLLPGRPVHATASFIVFKAEHHAQIAEIINADVTCYCCPVCKEKLVKEEHQTLDGEEFVGWSCGCTVPQAT